MWQRTSSLKASYDDELLKQTDPYAYFLKHNMEVNKDKTDEGEHENVPFICMEKIVKTEEDEEKTVYEYEDYLLFESKKGFASEAERAELLTYAVKLNADLIYSDYDHVDSQGKKHTPFYKPDFGIDTFRCFDMYSEFYAVKKQKSRMILNLLENVAHVTKTLFHFRCENNTENIMELHKNNNINNGGYLTNDTYLGEFKNNGLSDEISIVIPSKDNPKLIETCLSGIKNAKIKSGINTIEVVIVDNGSAEGSRALITDVIKTVSCGSEENMKADEYNAELSVYEGDGGIRVKYVYKPETFNFSAMCNLGVKLSSGQYLLFLNDDIEITDELFIQKLLYFAKMDHVGAVGCKLLYPGEEGRIQHTGITVLKYPGPSHKLSTFTDDKEYYFGRNSGVHDCLAVTGACLMVSREKYFKTGGFHDKMKVGYNDVDLCVSLYENGLMNVVNNDCILIHHESVTRGSDAASEAKLKRLDEERNLLYKRHPWILEKGDPFYNPNLAGDFLDYRINVIPDFEKRDYMSKEHRDVAFKAADLITERAKPSKNLHFNVENINKNRDVYEITGWSLVNRKKNFLFDTYLVVICRGNNSEAVDIIEGFKKGSNDAVRVFETAKVRRCDLGAVFPEAKDVEISGFMARIPAEIYEKEDTRLGILMINKQTGKKYYAGYDKSDI